MPCVSLCLMHQAVCVCVYVVCRAHSNALACIASVLLEHTSYYPTTTTTPTHCVLVTWPQHGRPAAMLGRLAPSQRPPLE
jgi:hypothetical protein